MLDSSLVKKKTNNLLVAPKFKMALKKQNFKTHYSISSDTLQSVDALTFYTLKSVRQKALEIIF